MNKCIIFFYQFMIFYIKNTFYIFWKSCINAAKFKTRANRSEYIKFHFVWFIINIMCLLFLHIKPEIIKNLYTVINIILVLPSFSIAIRMVHDFNISGWSYFFIHLITFMITIFIMWDHESINLEKVELSVLEQVLLYSPSLIYAVLVLKKGTPGPNKYGPPPEY